MTNKVSVLLLLLTLTFTTYAQSAKTRWVDSVFHAMNVSEKVGQLFLVPVNNKSDGESIDHIQQLIQNLEIGGLVFNEGKILPPPTLLASFHDQSDVPLFVAYNGRADALPDSSLFIPAPRLLGASGNDTLLFQYGYQLGKYLHASGVNVLFTTVDLLPGSPAIDNLLSQNLQRSVRKNIPIMRGLQEHGVATIAKHFTVNGVTVGDARKDLQVSVNVDTVRTKAFAELVSNGVDGIMSGPVELPIFYGNMGSVKKNYSTPLLTTVFNGAWMRSNFSYDGLSVIHTGSLKMEGAEEGDTEVLAFRHGNDVIISKDVALAIKKIKRLVRKDEFYKEQLNASVRRILAAKYDAKLWQKEASTYSPLTYATKTDTRLVNQRIHEEAITIIQDPDHILPITTLDNRTFAYVSTYHSPKSTTLFEYLSKYAGLTNHLVEKENDTKELLKTLQSVRTIVVGIFPETTVETLTHLNNVLDRLTHNPDIIVCDLGNSGILATAYRYPAVVTAYSDDDIMIRSVPQVIFGALPARGTLPFSVSARYPEGTGIKAARLGRLSYSIPEDAGVDAKLLSRIDSIAKEAIATRATPGCQVLVARQGKVIYEKSFGHLTYDGKEKVTSKTIYDLASVTKVSATLQTAMFMYDHGLLDLHKKVSNYLPELKKTNKRDITVIDMLTHQSGLVPFIPMYNSTIKDTTFMPLYYNRVQSEKYPLQVANRLYASTNLRDSVWSWVLKSKMNEKPARTPYSYKYSDLGFMILQHIAERVLNQPMDDFLSQNLYEPIGGVTLGFNPLTRFEQARIAPTEDDKIYRRTSVAGTVHDERAAMLGGVSGHAGLFGSASDLAKLCQMWLQNGSYGGYQYFKPETIRLFTAKKFRTSHRGIGWDKPVQGQTTGSTSVYASPQTFGHTGFTGTCIWIDPEFDLVYIFLSNRVYPDRSSKLINANIRSRIQDVIYRSIFAYQAQEKPQFFPGQGQTIKAGEVRPLE